MLTALSKITFLSIVSFSIAFQVKGQDMSDHIDSLNVEFGVLLKKDLEAAGRLADSVLNTSMKQNFLEGVICGKLQVAKYLRKIGEYDSAKNVLKENLVRTKQNLNSISVRHQQTIWRLYAVSHYDLAVIAFYEGDYDLAFDFSLLSDSIQDYFFKGKDFDQKRYLSSKRTAKMLRANVYSVKGDIDRAIVLFEEGARENEEAGKLYNAAVTYQNLGGLYRDKGRLFEAINVLKKSQRITEENQFTSLNAIVIGAISQVFFAMNEYEEALSFSLQSYKLHESLDDEFRIAYTAVDVGDSYKKIGESDSALWYYNKSLTLHQELGNMDDVAYTLERLASLKADMDDCESALAYMEEGFKVVKENNLPEGRLQLKIINAQCLLKSGQLRDALKLTGELLELAKETQNLSHEKDIYDLAHKVYELAGYEEKAYDYLTTYIALQDSIYTKEKATEIARVEYKYELEKERSRLKAESDRQQLVFKQKLSNERLIRLVTVGVSFLILLVAVFAVRAYRIKRSSNIQLTEKNQKLEILRKSEQKLSVEAIASRERELATMAMASHEKNSVLDELNQKISFLENRLDDELKPDLKEMKKTIANSYSLDNSWDTFLHKFENVHPQFFDKLKGENPLLTAEDLKLSAYLKIGMSNKEIANVTHLTLGSVKSKINRLKKKIELKPEESLRDYILKYA